MKKIFPLFFALLWILSVKVCQAKEPGEFAEDFFTLVKSGKIADAFDRLFMGSEIPYLHPRQIQMLREKTSEALRLYGNVVAHEKIREEKFAKSVVRLVYVLKLEKGPLIWELYFYMPKNKWFVSEVDFSDRFQLLQSME
jgi:hypothetical protein